MRLFESLLAGLGLIGLIALFAWSYVEFPRLANALEAELQMSADQALIDNGHDWASVSINGQRAMLTGTAPNDQSVTAASLTVLRSTGSGGYVRGGVMIVESSAQIEQISDPFVWRVTQTDDGRLILDGKVPSELVRNRLVTAAEALARIGVEDRQTISTGAPSGAWLDVALIGLSAVAELDAGTLILEDNALSLLGVATDLARRSRLSGAIIGVPAPFSGSAELRGTHLWSARHGGGTLILEGTVPESQDRFMFLDLAQNGAGGDLVIVDNLEQGDQLEAGAWTTDIAVMLPHFVLFQSGYMGYEPDGEELLIDGRASMAVLEALRDEVAAYNGGLTIRIQATSTDPVNLNGDVSEGTGQATNRGLEINIEEQNQE